ncbi:pilus assembly protein [Tessaracoccus sp. OS52]|uniref:TadE/TadG family type IV pilus assembly protein n=1 Tax=Tessaracoccus sp. OS52 TaxID=2886691 RepID=UPI001D12D85F|nr:pilus assembly protein [Tessaracoccus sp. OS52]
MEFALVLPVLLTLLLGTIEFGWTFMVQGGVAGAAREAARDFAIHDDAAKARGVAVAASGPAGLTTGEVAIAPGSCTPGSNVTVTINHTYPSLTGFFGANFTATGEGVMRCGG